MNFNFKRVYEGSNERIKAFDLGETFRADSVRFLKRAPILKGLSDDELYARFLLGEVKYDKGLLTPSLSGGADSGYYSVTINNITTGTALKTIIELIAGANVNPTIVQWWCEFDGSSAATAILVELLRATASFTGGNSVTPTLMQVGRKAVQSTCNSGVAASTNTTEGTRGAIFEQHYVPPTSGIIMQYPIGREPDVSDRCRISTTAGAAVHVACGELFTE